MGVAVSEELFLYLSEILNLPYLANYPRDILLNVCNQQFLNDVLVIASVRGDVRFLRELIYNLGADVNYSGEHGYTPLHEAYEQGHIEAAKFLILYGADEKRANDDGYCPIDLYSA
jgi:ankyrin repeat protein